MTLEMLVRGAHHLKLFLGMREPLEPPSEDPQTEIQRPVPKEQSLGEFFRQVGITDLISGIYNLDYDGIPLENLDAYIKAKNFSIFASQFPDGAVLQRVTDDMEREESPHVTSGDGTRYTFHWAKFVDEQFLLKTSVEWTDGKRIEATYSLDEIRTLLGSV